MSKHGKVTCSDCYFREQGLCALQLAEPCPTFRTARRGRLVPPPQARLVPRTLDAPVVRHETREPVPA